jgi:hypothetical protein
VIVSHSPLSALTCGVVAWLIAWTLISDAFG